MVMNDTTVTVTAEWALWGKETGDAGYHLLDCSDGPVSRENFDEVLTRYSPGTLVELPQATISWLSDKEQPSYLAIAIHDAADRVQYDVSGREIVLTRYFCVPFNELAAGAVSYRAMYEKFHRTELPIANRHRIKAKLAMAEPSGKADAFATRVAALLLTSKPVCILAADRVAVDERLQFLDRVVSLLPYGMRSRLSASTWASSTFREHRLRLFFASARRPGDDHVVIWNQIDPEPIRNPYAHGYLSWLSQDVPGRVARLAKERQEMGFSQLDVLKMLELLGIMSDQPTRPTYSQEVVRWAPAEPPRIMSVEELLNSCGEQLRDGKFFLMPKIDRLRQHLRNPPSEELRSQYRLLIQHHQLLREDLPVERKVRAQFYDVLLRLAFGTPLTYRDYCNVEACVLSNPEGQQLHRPLVLAIEKVGWDGLVMRLLVLSAIGGKELKDSLRKHPVAPGDLLLVTADRNLHRLHAQVVFHSAMQHLLERTGYHDRSVLRPILHHYGYLAPTLNWLYPGDPDYQLSWLRQLLHLGYGGELDRSAIRDVLRSPSIVPTSALLAAVLLVVDRADVELVQQEYTRCMITSTRFASETCGKLLRLLPENDYTEIDPGNEEPFSNQVDSSPRRRGWHHRLAHPGRRRH
jgi:hypothetical protein